MRASCDESRAQRDIHSHHADASFWSGSDVEHFTSARRPGRRGTPVCGYRIPFCRASIPLDEDLFLTPLIRAIDEPLAIGRELREAFVDCRLAGRMHLPIAPCA